MYFSDEKIKLFQRELCIGSCKGYLPFNFVENITLRKAFANLMKDTFGFGVQVNYWLALVVSLSHSVSMHKLSSSLYV